MGPLQILYDWATEHGDEMTQSRHAYEAKVDGGRRHTSSTEAALFAPK